MKIAVGADHGGVDYKNEIKVMLEGQGHEIIDFGTYDHESVDYNDYALKVAQAVAQNEAEAGILICGTGIGMSIMANKVDGIRAALVSDTFTAKATREHNNSNVLAMGGRTISKDLALEIADIWVNTKFSNDERHVRRIRKIDNYHGE